MDYDAMFFIYLDGVAAAQQSFHPRRELLGEDAAAGLGNK
jgi:hypothetical protein